jgi:hypothetical protein
MASLTSKSLKEKEPKRKSVSPIVSLNRPTPDHSQLHSKLFEFRTELANNPPLTYVFRSPPLPLRLLPQEDEIKNLTSFTNESQGIIYPSTDIIIFYLSYLTSEIRLTML